MVEEPLRVLVITSRLPPAIGGIAIYAAEVSQGLKRLGHDVTVVIRDNDPDLSAELDLDIIAVQTKGLVPPLKRREARATIIDLCREKRIQVVLFAQPVSGLGNIYSQLQKAQIPYVVTLHTYKDGYVETEQKKTRRRRKWGLPGAAQVVANTDWLAEKLTPLADRPIETVYLGVNRAIDEWATPEKVKKVKDEYDLHDKKVVLCLGRFHTSKNFKSVVHIMPRILETFPEAVLLMVGEGKEEENLKSLARELGLGDRVIWIREVPYKEVGVYYKAADVFVTVSKSQANDDTHETFGLVYAEANLCGTAVVGGNEGGVVEAVEDGKTGLLVSPGDPDSLELAVTRVLGDNEFREELGREGRRRAADLFNWETTVTKISGILTDAVRTAGHSDL